MKQQSSPKRLTNVWYGKADGKAGLEYRISTYEGGLCVVWVPGTDHQKDVLHHFRWKMERMSGEVWALKADVKLAQKVAADVRATGCSTVRVYGHSWGAAIALLVGWFLYRAGFKVAVGAYGPKRVGNEAFIRDVAKFGVVKFAKGDLVGCLPPWLAKYTTYRTFGKWRNFWKAHQPKVYYSEMVKDGYRW